MDGNKDDASRCLRIAEDAIVSGDKERALRFIRMAKRLNPSLSVDELVASCDNLDSVSKNPSLSVDDSDKLEPQKTEEKKKYTEENVELVSNIKRNNDYYTILGLEKNCSVEEIRKAYRKLSLKVHPDKNKAPGSEEAFKKVSKAFTCLSDGNSRSKYDQVGFVDEVDHIQRQNRRPRRRYNPRNDFFDDEFDPDEIFRAFFGQQRDMFRHSHAYRTRQARNQPREEEPNVAGPSCLMIIQILPFFLLLLLAYLPFSEPDYSLHKNQSYQIPKMTQNMEISFYVTSSSAFDEKFPLGSSARAKLEANVIKEYRSFLLHSCRIELQKRRWNRKIPTPHCNELHDRGFVDSLSVDELVASCDNLDSVSKNPSLSVDDSDKLEPQKTEEKKKYTEENVELVSNIKRNNDYYTILGLEKNCSVEEIRKAYRKLSLKVHPDKNKAPGSEEAFKKVSKAFTCLSDGNSRSKYDQVGFVDEVDHIQRQNRRPRRRYNPRNDFFDDEFDPDEIFRAFFGQQRDMFRHSHAYRTRQARNQPREEEPNVAGPSCLMIIQILPFFLLLLLAYLPFSEPDYSLHKNQSYQIPKMTQNMEISFYVTSSSAFDEKFPLGSSARAKLEANVIKEYRSFLLHSCRIELQKRRWNRKIPTPHCNELHDRGFVDRQIPI